VCVRVAPVCLSRGVGVWDAEGVRSADCRERCACVCVSVRILLSYCLVFTDIALASIEMKSNICQIGILLSTVDVHAADNVCPLDRTLAFMAEDRPKHKDAPRRNPRGFVTMRKFDIASNRTRDHYRDHVAFLAVNVVPLVFALSVFVEGACEYGERILDTIDTQQRLCLYVVLHFGEICLGCVA
jgi:hypothetical protein